MKTEATESFPTVSDVLKRAREHLQRGWCQGDLALEGRGRRASPTAPDAVQFCAMGAIVRAAKELASRDYRMEREAVKRLEDTLAGGEEGMRASGGSFPVVRWNNDPSRTQEEVLAAFDRAAEGK